MIHRANPDREGRSQNAPDDHGGWNGDHRYGHRVMMTQGLDRED